MQTKPKPDPDRPTKKPNRLASSKLKTSQDFDGSKAKVGQDAQPVNDPNGIKPLVVNLLKDAPYDVYIGRDNNRKGLKDQGWGNPFEIGVHGTREEVIDLYAEWIVKQPDIQTRLIGLRGKRLGCYCHPRPCHGDVLARLVVGQANDLGNGQFYAMDDERRVLGSMMLSPKFTDTCLSLTADHFSPLNRTIFIALADLYQRGAPIDHEAVTDLLGKRKELDAAGGQYAIFNLQIDGTTGAITSSYHLDQIQSAYRLREERRILTTISTALTTGESCAVALETATQALANLDKIGGGGVAKMLADRRYDANNPPPKAPPIYSLGGVCIATSGNLTAITGQAKSGKSSLLAAMIAAAHDPTGDTLGLTANNDRGGALIHFDTEQAPEDHFSLVGQALRRAVRPSVLPWFRSYCLTDQTPPELLAALKFEAAAALEACGFIHSIIVDGIADLVWDVNDPTESNTLVLEIRALSIKYSCPVVCVLHENPTTESGGRNKTRGHLGSQLERKAFASLTLSKDADGVVSVYSGNSRKLHIAKDGAPSFVWSDDVGMHISCQAAAPKTGRAASIKLSELANRVFDGVMPELGLRYSQVVETIEAKSRERISNATARRRVDEMLEAGLIVRGVGAEDDRYFTPKPPQNPTQKPDPKP
jgi:hypothetical protein